MVTQYSTHTSTIILYQQKQSYYPQHNNDYVEGFVFLRLRICAPPPQLELEAVSDGWRTGNLSSAFGKSGHSSREKSSMNLCFSPSSFQTRIFLCLSLHTCVHLPGLLSQRSHSLSRQRKGKDCIWGNLKANLTKLTRVERRNKKKHFNFKVPQMNN